MRKYINFSENFFFIDFVGPRTILWSLCFGLWMTLLIGFVVTLPNLNVRGYF